MDVFEEPEVPEAPLVVAVPQLADFERIRTLCFSDLASTPDELRRVILQLGQRQLQDRFRKVYQRATWSNNNTWLRRYALAFVYPLPVPSPKPCPPIVAFPWPMPSLTDACVLCRRLLEGKSDPAVPFRGQAGRPPSRHPALRLRRFVLMHHSACASVRLTLSVRACSDWTAGAQASGASAQRIISAARRGRRAQAPSTSACASARGRRRSGGIRRPAHSQVRTRRSPGPMHARAHSSAYRADIVISGVTQHLAPSSGAAASVLRVSPRQESAIARVPARRCCALICCDAPAHVYWRFGSYRRLPNAGGSPHACARLRRPPKPKVMEDAADFHGGGRYGTASGRVPSAGRAGSRSAARSAPRPIPRSSDSLAFDKMRASQPRAHRTHSYPPSARRAPPGSSDGDQTEDELDDDSALISTSSGFDGIHSPEAFLPLGAADSDGETGSEGGGGRGYDALGYRARGQDLEYETRSQPASFVSTQGSYDFPSFTGCVHRIAAAYLPCHRPPPALHACVWRQLCRGTHAS